MQNTHVQLSLWRRRVSRLRGCFTLTEVRLPSPACENPVFLHDLAPTNKAVFFELAKRIVDADGRVAPEEAEMLKTIANELGPLPNMDPLNKQPLSELCSQIRTRQAQIVILMELASIAHIDNEYHEKEQAFVNDLAALWGIDRFTVIGIERWASDRVALVRNAGLLLREALSQG